MNVRVLTVACTLLLLASGCESPGSPASAGERGEDSAPAPAAVEQPPVGEEAAAEPEASAPQPAATESAAAEASTSQPAQAVPAKSVLVPAGTLFRVRTNGAVDSTSMVPGHRVTATLTEDLTVGESVVLPKGTLVYARLVRTDGEARALALKPTDVLFAGRLTPISTTDLAVQVEEQPATSPTDLRRPKLDLPSTAPSVTLAGPVVQVPEGTVLQFRLEKTLELGA